MNSEEFLFGDIPLLRADRQPCIVCGHPTGDCKDIGGQDVGSLKSAFFKATAESSEEKTILVEEDIIQERQITPFSRSMVLVAKAGTYITPSKAKEFGII